MSRANVIKKIWDFLVLLVCGTIGGIALFAGLLLCGHWYVHKACERDKAELNGIFAQAIADGTVPDVAKGAFRVTQRHTGDPFFTIWFTNTNGQRTGYFVSEQIYKRGIWEFKELPPEANLPQRIFYRERVKKP